MIYKCWFFHIYVRKNRTSWNSMLHPHAIYVEIFMVNHVIQRQTDSKDSSATNPACELNLWRHEKPWQKPSTDRTASTIDQNWANVCFFSWLCSLCSWSITYVSHFAERLDFTVDVCLCVSVFLSCLHLQPRTCNPTSEYQLKSELERFIYWLLTIINHILTIINHILTIEIPYFTCHFFSPFSCHLSLGKLGGFQSCILGCLDRSLSASSWFTGNLKNMMISGINNG